MNTLNFNPADHPEEWELVGRSRDGVPIYAPRDVEGCGDCDNGICCGDNRDDDLAGVCCGEGEAGPCS